MEPSDAYRQAVQHAMDQPGGYRQIDYKDHSLMVPLDHIKQALEMLADVSERSGLMRRVNAALDAYYPRLDELNPENVVNDMSSEMMNFCQDVVIWFANEILEGRQNLNRSVH